jgi:hypothetical protein
LVARVAAPAAHVRRAAFVEQAARAGLRTAPSLAPSAGSSDAATAATAAAATGGCDGQSGEFQSEGEVHYWVPGVHGAHLANFELKHVLARDLKQDSFGMAVAGCFMSHVTVWREVVDKGLPFAVVLEDDVQLSARCERGRFLGHWHLPSIVSRSLFEVVNQHSTICPISHAK